MKRLVVVFCGIFFSCNLESQSEIPVTSQSQTVAVSGDYDMLYTMVYAVPETRSDEIAGKNSFRLTAQASSRSVSANPSSAVFSAKETGTSSAAPFYGRLGGRENALFKNGATGGVPRAVCGTRGRGWGGGGGATVPRGGLSLRRTRVAESSL